MPICILCQRYSSTVSPVGYCDECTAKHVPASAPGPVAGTSDGDVLQLLRVISTLPEATWNNQSDAINKRELIQNTWNVCFRALTLSDVQAQEIERLAPIDKNFRDINAEFQIRLSANSIFVHTFGAWTDPGYVKFCYHDKLYYVNVALGIQLTTSIYNRTDDLSHMAKIAIVLGDQLGVLERRKRVVIVLDGSLEHRAA